MAPFMEEKIPIFQLVKRVFLPMNLDPKWHVIWMKKHTFSIYEKVHFSQTFESKMALYMGAKNFST